MLGAVSAISYLERVCISVISPLVMEQVSLDQPQMGRVFSAFMLGYALCQYPSGSLSDRFGTKRVLGWAMLAWGILTIATALVEQRFFASLFGTFNALLGVRFLLGVAEAPTYPASTRVVSTWFQKPQQAKAISVFAVGMGAGSALASPLVARLMLAWGWKAALWIISIPAFVMALVWAYKGGEKRGAEQTRLSQKETAAQTRAVLRSKNSWLITLSYFLSNYVFYVFVFWFFPYLVQVRNFDILESSWIATAPWILTIFMAPAGGTLSDWLIQKLGEPWGRRILPLTALTLAGVLMSAGARQENAYLAVVALTLCEGLVILVDPGYWASAIRVAPGSAGRAGGFMNMGGNLGGLISASMTPVIANRFSWEISLDFTGLLAMLAGVLWLGVRLAPPQRRIFETFYSNSDREYKAPL